VSEPKHESRPKHEFADANQKQEREVWLSVSKKLKEDRASGSQIDGFEHVTVLFF
jgi:hypothetical protein